jgi:alkanesulfonate monooxygenase SsuD/methylene tetrahydromethanopterin reductase-like flavin-dependent oxidoreductase (luciferase family)
MYPRLGYLALFDNPTAEDGRALIRTFVLAREADRMGYDDIWVAEHHFDGVWPSGASTALLGHLAGITSRARIGAAVLPALRDPIQLAEDLATADLLSKGRLNLAVSRGGPFPAQYGHFKLDPDAARARAFEALHLIGRLFNEEEVSFEGKFHRVDALRLALRPSQQPLPTWIATADAATIREAARAGVGLMAGAACTHARVLKMLSLYRDALPKATTPPDPRLTLARFCFAAPTRAEALAVAEPYLRDFAARMRVLPINSDANLSVAANPEALLAISMVGSYDDVASQIRKLQTDLSVYSLVLIPTSAQFDAAKRCLAAIIDEVRPRMED